MYDRSGTDLDLTSEFFPPGKLSGLGREDPRVNTGDVITGRSPAFNPFNPIVEWDKPSSAEDQLSVMQDIMSGRGLGGRARAVSPDAYLPQEMVDAGQTSPLPASWGFESFGFDTNMNAYKNGPGLGGLGLNVLDDSGNWVDDVTGLPVLDTQTDPSLIPWGTTYPDVRTNVGGNATVPAGTNPAEVFGTSTLQEWANVISKAIVQGQNAIAQAKIIDLNYQRAQKGLPPLSAAQFAPGVNVGLDPATQDILLKVALIGGAAFLGMKMFGSKKR